MAIARDPFLRPPIERGAGWFVATGKNDFANWDEIGLSRGVNCGLQIHARAPGGSA